MKTLFTFCFATIGLAAWANNPYSYFLRARAQQFSSQAGNAPILQETNTKPPVQIPKIETPRGAVFCRMEDYLTQKTKVWIKIGVK